MSTCSLFFYRNTINCCIFILCPVILLKYLLLLGSFCIFFGSFIYKQLHHLKMGQFIFSFLICMPFSFYWNLDIWGTMLWDSGLYLNLVLAGILQQGFGKGRVGAASLLPGRGLKFKFSTHISWHSSRSSLLPNMAFTDITRAGRAGVSHYCSHMASTDTAG